LDVDRRTLIGRSLRSATYTVTEVDVNDFLGVVDEPEFVAVSKESGTATATETARLAPPSFAPFVAVLGLLKTFDWQEYEKQGKSRFDVIEVAFEITGGGEGDRLMSGQQSYILFK
jgi:hypothetical protein